MEETPCRPISSVSDTFGLYDDLLGVVGDEPVAAEEIDLENESFLSVRWKAQVIVINEEDMRAMYMYPKQYTDDLPHIYLLKRKTGGHVDLITNLERFGSQQALGKISFCFHCNKTKFINDIPHACTKDKSKNLFCQCCWRRFFTQNTYLDNRNKKNFCLSKLFPEGTTSKCDRCNATLKSQDCQKRHEMYCLKMNTGVHFDCCGKYIAINRQYESCVTREKILSEHKENKCKGIKCWSCNIVYVRDIDRPHICRTKVINIPPTSKTYAVIDFAEKNKSATCCYVCRNKSTIELDLCPVHFRDNVLQTTENCEYSLSTVLVERPQGFFKYQFQECQTALDSGRTKYQGHPQFLKKEETEFSPGPKLLLTSSRLKLILKYRLQDFLGRKNSDCTVVENALRSILKYENISIFSFQENLPIIYSTLLANQIEATLTRQTGTRKITSIGVGSITFLDIANFISDSCLLLTYKDIHLFFPEVLNRDIDDCLHTGTSVPELGYFLSVNDSEEIIEAKKSYHSSLVALGSWNIDTRLKLFANYRCKLMLSGVRQLMKQAKEIVSGALSQEDFPESKLANLNFLNYFNYGAFLQDIFLVSANSQNHSFFQHTSRGSSFPSSAIEYEWICTTVWSEKLTNPKHNFNTAGGQLKVGDLYPDLISDDISDPHQPKKIYWYFNGCHFHGRCSSTCRLILQGRTRGVNNKCLFLLAQESKNKIAKFKNFIGDSGSVRIVSECQFFASKKHDPIKHKIFREETQYAPRPRTRLNARDSYTGGLNEVFQLAWEAKEEPENDFHFIDLNSAYVSQAMSQNFPIGKYETLIGSKLNAEFTFDSVTQVYMYKGQPAYGLVHAKVLAPKDLRFPILSAKIKLKGSGARPRNISAVCRTCAEKRSVLKCGHKEPNRAITSSWTILELNAALRRGYKVIQIYEAHVYEKFAKVGKQFFELIHYLKMKNSGFPQTGMSYKDKVEYCEKINKEANFPSKYKLSPEIITNDPLYTKNLKLHLVRIFGRFGQKSYDTRTTLTRDVKDLTRVIKAKTLVSFSHPSQDHILITERIKKKRCPKKTSLCFAAYINAYTRLHLFDCFDELEKIGASIYYTDTDSIMYTLERSKRNIDPIRLGTTFGSFKNECRNITSFFSLGGKKYRLNFKNDAGETVSVMKSAGLCVTPYVKKHSELDNECYTKMVNALLQNIKLSVPVPQRRLRRSDVPKKVKDTWNFHHLSNFSYVKRKIIKVNDAFVTRPYGFTLKNV